MQQGITIRKILTVGLLFMTLGGCATVPMASNEADVKAKEFATPPDGKSGLYIFIDSFIGKGLKKTIRVDGEIIGESAPCVYFYKILEAGKYVISTESEFSPNALMIKTEEKKNYFVENYIKWEFCWRHRFGRCQ